MLFPYRIFCSRITTPSGHTGGQKMSVYSEMMSKTGLYIQGLVRSVNIFVGEKKEYRSVDIDVKGCRMPITVKLGDKFPFQQLIEGEITKIMLVVKPNFAKNGVELHAAEGA
jgi:hypothetical protein